MIDAMTTQVTRIASRAWFARVLSLGIAGGISTVFALSALLVPSPDGHGTHLQLGLGPCTFLSLTGWPCPMCGATTTFTLMAHLRPVDAVVNQPFASFLFVLSAGVLGVAVAEVVDPRRRWDRILRWLAPRESRLASAFLAFMIVSWAYKAARMAGWF
jgi:hypothetical protein